ncbi:PRK06851 family protein [Natroniella sulfidigena]|uniref:PRK06851 family protein n=1 Tax=Natroniella sulfidigena TaxID=723921 RepID=UPI00200AE95A|nr:PRK06851 family protein [Natroniella sulfidigena]MCK8816437.1 PRK06851 family protein [Natroniella sulfidigena]
MIKNYFSSGNTSKGFYSFFEYLPYQCDRVFMIKGGPGTGKSTFMKRIAEKMVEEGYDLEKHWCSSDKESLDGVVIPQLKVAFLDATAPHLVDPKYPGAVDEIINLGRYWDRSPLEENKDEIVSLSKAKWNSFQKAYAYLKEAKLIHDEWEDYYLEGMNFQQANRKAEELIEQIFGEQKLAEQLGAERHLFGSAFTAQGTVDYFDNITNDMEYRYIIKGRAGTGKSTLVKRVGKAARERGFDVCYGHCSFDPESVDLLVIDELKVALLDGTAPHVVDPADQNDQIVNMLECVDSEVIKSNKRRIANTKRRYQIVMDKARDMIKQAKFFHDEQEDYYIEAMDFSAVEERRQEVEEEVLKAMNSE